MKGEMMSLYEEAWEKLRARILPSHDPNVWHSAKKIIKMMDECLGEAEKEVEQTRLKLQKEQSDVPYWARPPERGGIQLDNKEV